MSPDGWPNTRCDRTPGETVRPRAGAVGSITLIALPRAIGAGAEPSMFVGTHIVGVDAKGRLSVPAPFRAALKGADLIYVWPSYQGPWLEGGDAALLARLHAALDARGELDDVRDDFAYAIFAEARALSFDETGRASLPEDLRAHAKLAGKAAFAGLSDRFEIWAPDLLQERVEKARTAAAGKRGLIAKLAREGAP